MAARHELSLDGDLRSDVAPINGLVRAALEAGGDGVVAMKDPTRGGLSSALHEMAAEARVGILLEESAVPVRTEVRGASDLLGIDPLVVANEGKAVIGVRPDAADAVLAAIRAHPLGRDAARIGRCIEPARGRGHPRHRVRPADAGGTRRRAAAADLLRGCDDAHPTRPRRPRRHDHDRPARALQLARRRRPRGTCARPASSARATPRSAPSSSAAKAACSAAAPT